MNSLTIIITAVATIIGALSGAFINRSIARANNAKSNADNADAIGKLHKLYIDTLNELETSRKEYNESSNQFIEEISANKKEIERLRETVEKQDNKIDKLTALMELVCMDIQCTDRKRCMLNTEL